MTNTKTNYIIKLIITNEIQSTKIHKNYGVVFYIIIFLHCE